MNTRSQNTTPLHDKLTGMLFGLAAGDALGTTLEFTARDSNPPLTDIVGGGPFGLPPGAWTDDTSMALCLGESLIACKGFDPADQMRRYLRWHSEGHLSSTGRCFDIGITTLRSLQKFEALNEPYAGSTDPHSAGNGSIMRLAPVVMYFHGQGEEVCRRYAAESSRTTHGAPECLDGCELMASALWHLASGSSREKMLVALGKISLRSAGRLTDVQQGGFTQKSRAEIKGSGYVVDSLEAALWCLFTTDSFKDAVLMAANLGDDADTTAAVCGQLAGAFYGKSAIPASWLAKLALPQTLDSIAAGLVQGGSERPE